MELRSTALCKFMVNTCQKHEKLAEQEMHSEPVIDKEKNDLLPHIQAYCVKPS